MLRGRSEAHSHNITCGDFGMHLDLIVTGGRDNKVKIWDYERLITFEEPSDNIGPTTAHKNEITLVKFIKPFPLLITCDLTG